MGGSYLPIDTEWVGLRRYLCPVLAAAGLLAANDQCEQAIDGAIVELGRHDAAVGELQPVRSQRGRSLLGRLSVCDGPAALWLSVGPRRELDGFGRRRRDGRCSERRQRVGAVGEL